MVLFAQSRRRRRRERRLSRKDAPLRTNRKPPAGPPKGHALSPKEQPPSAGRQVLVVLLGLAAIALIVSPLLLIGGPKGVQGKELSEVLTAVGQGSIDGQDASSPPENTTRSRSSAGTRASRRRPPARSAARSSQSREGLRFSRSTTRTWSRSCARAGYGAGTGCSRSDVARRRRAHRRTGTGHR